MRRALTCLSQGFSSKAPEFNKYFLLRIDYGPDGYYETFPYREQFHQQIKKVQEEGEARILGGDHRPKQATTLMFNCNSPEVAQRFVKESIYNQKKVIAGWEISELSLQSTEKFEKVWNFYQPLLE